MDRSDATGLGIAAVGHIALLAALILLVPKEPIALPGAPSIEVSFEEEVGIVSAGETTTPAAASVAPELGAPDDAAPAPEPVSEPQPAPTPTPAPPQPAPRQTSPRPQAPAPQRAAPQQQRALPQPARNAPQPKAATPPGRSGTAPTPRGSRLGRDFLKGIGNDPASTSQKSVGTVVSNQARASMDAAILRQLQPCRRQALPAPEAGAMRVRVEVILNPNGSLSSARVLTVSGATGSLAIYEQRMRDIAVNVIEQCAPIRDLPAEYYSVARGWRRFTYTFPA